MPDFKPTLKWKPNGSLADATTVTLSNSANTYGIFDNTSLTNVVAAGTAATHDGTGLYSYNYEDATANHSYTAYWKVVYAGQTNYFQFTATVGADDVVDLTTIKLHCRIDDTTDDTLLTMYRAAAIKWCEEYTQRSIESQTHAFVFASWSELEAADLGYPPINSVVITYKDTAGASTTLSSSQYILDNNVIPGRIVPAYNCSWPSTPLYPASPITVTATCGYTTVPDAFKLAVLQLVSHWYEHREAVADQSAGNLMTVPLACEKLLYPYRVFSW